MNQTKPFNYQAFIEELTQLVQEAKEFRAADRKVNSSKFEKWHLHVIDLNDRIRKKKYNINCGIDSRAFTRRGYDYYLDEECQQEFDSDLEKTLNELNLLIDNYKKYGDPNADKLSDARQIAAAAPSAAKEQTWPESDKFTFRWLFDHMPIRAWTALGGVLFAAFTLGYWLGSHVVMKEETSNATPSLTAKPAE